MPYPEKHSVVITGLGPITPVGNGKAALWESVLVGRSGVRRVDFSWMDEHDFRIRVGAPAVPPQPADFLCSELDARLLDPATQFALAAATIALGDAGFRLSLVDDKRGRYRVEGVDPKRAGVVIGTGIGGLTTLEISHRRWIQKLPMLGAHRYALPMLIPNALPGQVGIKFGLQGENKAVTTACAAGTMALGDAYRLVRDGELDIVLAGGVEKVLTDSDGYGLRGFDMLKTLSMRNDEPEKASRPFDRDRDGFVMGEGAGLLVIERREHAVARGARIYCEVGGYSANSDAHSMLQIEPSGEQIVHVMNKALRAADLSPRDIGYVNAHGTATRANDATEAGALHRVFRHRILDVLVNSTKAMTGHAIGAAGGIEAIVTALSLHHRLVHRCVNLENPDPECDLNLPRETTAIPALAALSNSFGFGGHNATLVLRPV
jgi:3-oxoacyl-[acyl-carrier-protein] synthase II